MIVKKLIIPPKIETLQALHKRLRNNYPKRQEIQEELAKSLAGYKGEQSLDYYFHFLDPHDCFILHDLRLPNSNGSYFQIDILVLTPFFFLIIEVKNISGTLKFDPEFDQIIWSSPTNQTEIALPDPVRQVKHQQFQLIEWLEQKKCNYPPVESIVVLTNSKTIIKKVSNKKDYMQNIIRSTRLLEKIEQFYKQYTDKILPTKEIRRISNLFIKHHTPAYLNIYTQFDITKSDILTGVYCVHCSSFSMKYQRGKWICPYCSFSTKEAHIEALIDYVLLFQPSITTTEMKSFLHLPSLPTAYHLLHSMNLQHSGGFKGRKYYLRMDELE